MDPHSRDRSLPGIAVRVTLLPLINRIGKRQRSVLLG
jgi:hypothetical protein